MNKEQVKQALFQAAGQGKLDVRLSLGGLITATTNLMAAPVITSAVPAITTAVMIEPQQASRGFGLVRPGLSLYQSPLNAVGIAISLYLVELLGPEVTVALPGIFSLVRSYQEHGWVYGGTPYEHNLYQTYGGTLWYETTGNIFPVFQVSEEYVRNLIDHPDIELSTASPQPRLATFEVSPGQVVTGILIVGATAGGIYLGFYTGVVPGVAPTGYIIYFSNGEVIVKTTLPGPPTIIGGQGEGQGGSQK
jgi:hypothetical protein